ncbi:oligosaccharide flippase family protein [Teredinibacter haidensis]|uniref:oligosaccharide flippase family protein n=1 Tax=Teredinibacter haidensis TaxID=2731755 RepID=UPI000948C857|nr:oligosaccharide flippase family protein [Teredinibacter haidensis]
MPPALQHLIADKLFRNTSWMLITEAVAKVSRLITVIAMAACLSPEIFGIACLALACHELIRIFSRAGAGAVVIQCGHAELSETAGNASLLQWCVCVALTLLQFLAAESIADFYQQQELKPLLQIMAITYLCYPIVAVKVFMLQRENRFRYFSLANAVTVSVDNLSIAVFLLLDQGVFSVAYAKIITAVCWVVIFGVASVKTYAPAFKASLFFPLAKTSSHIFAAEGLRVLRAQLDVLIAARLLDPLAFGYYSFAKNAGVGLSQSIITAYISGLYPYVCEQLRRGMGPQVLRKSLTFAAAISLVFVAQSLLAPVYIALLFPQKWESSAALVSILCITGVSAIFTDTFSVFLRARRETLREVFLIAFTVVSAALAIILVQPSTSLALAWVTLLASFSCLLPLLLQLKIFHSNKMINQKVFS